MSWNIDIPTAEWYDVGDEGLDGLIREVADQRIVAIDTETTGLSNWKDVPLFWSLAWGNRKVCMPASTMQYFQKPVLNDHNRTWILANAKFDMHMLANYGIKLNGNIMDICVMHALLYDDMPHGLKEVSKQLLGWRWRDFEDTFEGNMKKEGSTAVLMRAFEQNKDLLVEYASNDAFGTLRAYQELRKQLEAEVTWSLWPEKFKTLWDVFRLTEAPYTRVLWKCERHGALIDNEFLATVRDPINEKIHEIQKAANKWYGRDVKLNSSDQLIEILIKDAGLRPIGWTDGGRKGIRKPKMDEKFFELYRNDHPIAGYAHEYKALTKLLSTYVDGIPKWQDPNCRIHPRYNQDVARCMPAGELVLTNRGYLPVEQVVVGDAVIAHTGKPRKVTEVSTHTPKPIYRVELSNGLVLRTTGNHQYFGHDSKWTRADELTVGQVLTVHSNKEQWLPIEGWDPFEVSSWGRVRNSATGVLRALQPKNEWGHLKVTLYRNGAQERGPDKVDFAVHRLVLRAFGGEMQLAEVRHLNGIAWDNTVGNLKYGTSQENTQDALRHGTLSQRRAGRTVLTEEAVQDIRASTRPTHSSPTAKLTFSDAVKMREAYAQGESTRDLALRHGISYTAARNILTKKTHRKESPNETRSARALAQKYGVSEGYIREVQSGAKWKAEDYIEGVAASFFSAHVVSVSREQAEATYGLTVEEDHSHVTGGVVTHNTGRLSASEPNCFHPNTELLTPAGWVRISEYAGGPIAQWEESGNISFVEPSAYIKKPADKLVHLNNQHIRLAVTEDHRCLLRHRKTGALKVFAGKDYPEDWQQIHAGHYRGGHLTMDEALLRLVVATQADGHVLDGAINFSFKKSRKSDRLLTILDQLGCSYSNNQGDLHGRVRIRLPKSDTTQKVLSLLGARKLFGRWILELSEESLHVFCEEVFFWDGSWTRKNNYASKEIENTAWVQTALSLIGKRAHMRTYVNQRGSVSYQVDVVDRDYSLTTNISKVTQDYNGDVYCVSVPSTYVVVRYDNHVHITGQCQNIPNPENDVFQIRRAFVARKGYKIICLDYEALEMRLLAAASMEPAMVDLFKKGWDIHMGNASMVFGLPYEDIKAAKKKDKKEHTDYDKRCLRARADVKAIGFGLNYGMKEKLLAANLGRTVEEAIEIRERYLSTYPTVDNFYQEAIETARKTKMAYTITGRRRRLPAINSHNTYFRYQAERQAVNMEIQGTAADVVRMAMIALDELGIDLRYGANMFMQVHDELLFECPEETAVEAKSLIQEMMSHPLDSDLEVPLTTSGHICDDWSQAK